MVNDGVNVATLKVLKVQVINLDNPPLSSLYPF